MVARTVTISPALEVHHPDFGDMTEDVARALAQLRREDHERLVREAEQRQRAIVQARPGEAVMHKEFAVAAEIDPAVVSHWRMRYGPGFWKHELKWFLKKNPQCAVKSRPLNPTVVVPEMPATLRKGPSARRGRWAL